MKIKLTQAPNNMEMKHNETKNIKRTVCTVYLHAPMQRASLRQDYDFLILTLSLSGDIHQK